jgi:ubiquinol-cytochrome c reductase iron-sulfur subunit
MAEAPRQPRYPNIPGEVLPMEACPRGPNDDPTERRVPASRGAETLTAVLLFASGACTIAFVVAIAFTSRTQLLGSLTGGAFLFAGAALVIAGRFVVPQETLIEAREPMRDPEQEAELSRALQSVGEGVTRKRLLLAAGGVAGGGVAAGALAATTQIGPWIGSVSIPSPFKDGVALVDVHGHPITADQLAVGSYLTAFAKGADTELLGSSVVVVRMAERDLRMPPARRGWTPRGIVAYSKICTHAGCAVAMARYPLFPPDAPQPALVCPCHYSTFDIADGGTVLFGPAGRPLPQLPLRVNSDGVLEAAGVLSAGIGPAWFNIQRT